MRLIYTLLFTAMLPLIFIRLLWRSVKSPDYRRRWRERLGYVPQYLAGHTNIDNAIKKRLWIHTASMGETIASKPLVEQLLKAYPDYQIVMTTMTPTGSTQTKTLFASEIQQSRILHSYIPYDLPNCIHRFLKWSNPTMAFFMETELWPNIIAICKQKDIATLLINARLSERSLKGYQRIKSLSQPMLATLTTVAAQTQSDAARLKRLANNDRPIYVTGSLKSEITLTDAIQQQAAILKKQWSCNEQRHIIIAASTHKGEEEIILSAYKHLKEQQSNLLLVLVPRHPERFNTVYQLCKNKHFDTRLKSSEHPSPETDIIVADTMGELLMLFGVADIAIMGGTFVDNGGHNFLEPAVWALPIMSGKSVYNFADIAKALVSAGGLTQVDSAEMLAKTIKTLLSDDALRQKQGLAAKRYIEQHRGSLERLFKLIDQHSRLK